MMSVSGKLLGDEPAAGDGSADGGGRAQKAFGSGSHKRPDRSRVKDELALRPGFSPPARMPPTARPCATRREAGVTGFDCGAGAVLLPALPHRPGGRVPT